METGIVLNDEAGNIPTRLRNIHLGNPYPELFELPEGYTLIVQDFSAQIKAQQEMEEMMKKRYEQLENMGKSGAQGDMRNKIDEGAAALEQLLNKMK